MNIQTQLAQGIAAAKNGEKAKAANLFYHVLDQDSTNKDAWLWLSAVVQSPEDRRVCLENVLTLDPNNQYAGRGLAQLNKLTPKQSSPAVVPSTATTKPVLHSLILMLMMAFWFGTGGAFLGIGFLELFSGIFSMLKSRTFPYYITPSQLWVFTLAVGFLILGILLLNIVWAISLRSKVGYFTSLIFSLLLILLAPTVLLIAGNTSYILVAFAALMPAIVLILTLLSQVGLTDDRQLASIPGKN